MANHQSAKKRAIQTIARTTRNRSTVNRMRTTLKKVEDCIKGKDVAKAQELVKAAQAEVMKTAQKGIIHKNTAARKISRLVARIRKI